MTKMGIIFANIYDSSLGELTNKRTMASLPYGGRYRQIDFSLSNLSNAGVRHVGIITKYNYQSLMNHVGSGQEWDMELEEGGLEFLSPYAMAHTGSYRGKLEALNSAMNFLQISKEDYVILIDSGVLCAIDLDQVVQDHIASGADVTVVVKDGITNGSKQLDLAVRLDAEQKVTDLAVDYCAGTDYLASMGIFVISRELLMKEVKEAVAHSRYHFERDFLLYRFSQQALKVNAYVFDGVALFNESTAEFYHNSLALIRPEIRHGLFGTGMTIYTKVRDQVPSYYGEASEIDDCIVADGCVLEGRATNSILFRGVQLGKGAKVTDSIIMSETVIGEGAELSYVILDKNVTVHPGAKLCGTWEHPLVLKRGENV